MDIKSTSTDVLLGTLRDCLAVDIDQLQVDFIRDILDELRRREPEATPEEKEKAWRLYMDLYIPDPVIDPDTGIRLTPSCDGKDCLGNGEHGPCCCDECDFYQLCFPNWKEKFSDNGMDNP